MKRGLKLICWTMFTALVVLGYVAAADRETIEVRMHWKSVDILSGLNVGITNNAIPTGVVNVVTGYRITNGAPSGYFLRGDGVNFVANTIQAGDIPASAPLNSPFVTATADGTLTAERVATGTANQVIITDGGANSTLTFSLPQSIGTGNSPTFTGLTISGLADTRIPYSSSGVLTGDSSLSWIASSKTLSVGTNILGQGGAFHIASSSDDIYLYPGGDDVKLLGSTGVASTWHIDGGNVGKLRLGGSGTPFAYLHLSASDGGSANAPLKFTSGSLLATALPGSVEYDGNEFYATTGLSDRHKLVRSLTGSANLDFDLTAVASQDLTVTVTGAADADPVSVGVPNGSVTADTLFWGWVSSANTVTVRAMRIAGTPNPGAGIFEVTVIKNLP